MKAPNYTQMPNELLDKHMREMGNAELRVVLAIVRLTIGWHARTIAATDAEIGALAGLSADSVKTGAAAAQAAGLIERVPGHGTTKSTWQIAIDAADIAEWEGVFTREGVFTPPSLGGATPPSPERKTRKSLSIKEKVKKDDPSRPAWVDLYQEVFKRNAPKELWDDVSRELGENPDLDRLREIFTRWKLEGWNRKSFAKMLAVYRDGWREQQPRANGNGNGSAQWNSTQPASAGLKIRRITA